MCGACRSVCPLYAVDLSESSVARGKVEVIRRDREGTLNGERGKYRTFLDNCLLCGRCETKCPNEVNTTGLFLQERARIAEELGIPFGEKALLTALSMTPSLSRGAAFVGKSLLAILAEKIPTSSGLYYKLPSLWGGEGRMLPPIPDRSYLSLKGKDLSAIAEEGGDLLFTGCVYNIFFPHVLESVSSLCNEDGSLSAPADQGCCGLPALAAGDMGGALKRGEETLTLFSRTGKGAIVFPCVSCLHMVKEVYPRLFEGTEREKEGRELSDRCVDFESYLSRRNEAISVGETLRKGGKISYHRPCHSLTIPGAVESAENLLRGLFPERFIPMEGADLCCGFGGTFSITHREKSIRMGEEKIRLAEKSGTEIIATSCSGCLTQLRESAGRKGSKIQVAHVGELLKS